MTTSCEGPLNAYYCVRWLRYLCEFRPPSPIQPKYSILNIARSVLDLSTQFMTNFRIPGPLGVYTFGLIDDGTQARTWSFAPGPRDYLVYPMVGIFDIPAVENMLSLSQADNATKTTEHEVSANRANSGGQDQVLHFKSPEAYEGPMRQHTAKLLSKISSFLPDSGRLLSDLNAFVGHYAKNAIRYGAVARKTGLPSQLIASLHWRESSGKFDCMLSNGSALGKKSTIVPYDAMPLS